VVPGDAALAARIAIFELRRLVEVGLTEEEFRSTRDYLLKNAFVMTARQAQQVGYALDSGWYGIPEYVRYLREGLARLTREEVNAAVRRHLSVTDLSFVFVARDARGLAEALVAESPPPPSYGAGKPAAILEEDRVIGAMKLGFRPEAIRITRAEEVFAR
jgi:zinc protease